LDKELKDPQAQQLDKKWEEFWQSGKNEEELIKLSKSFQLKVLPERLALLGKKFKDDKNFTVMTEVDIFANVYIKNKEFYMV
jgi:hypothetical protein